MPFINLHYPRLQCFGSMAPCICGRTTSARAPATWRQFLEDVPDRGLELSTLWATARAFQTSLGTDHEQTPEQEMLGLKILKTFVRASKAQQPYPCDVSTFLVST